MAARTTGSRLALPLLLVPGVGFLALFFGLPLFFAVLGGFGIGLVGVNTGFTLQHYVALFTSPIYRDGLLFSLYLSIVPTLLALLVAVPLAAAMQASFPGKKLFSTLYKIPLVVPGIVAAFLLMVFLDRGGMGSRLLGPMGVPLPKLVRDPLAIGVILAMAWKAVPFMALIIAGALASVPADAKAAARTLGARPWQVFLLIDLPLALPGISAATLLVFVGSTGAFAIPNLLGPIYPQPLSLYMYENAYVDNNWGLVAAMGTTLSVIACIVLVLYYRLTERWRGGERRA